MFAILLLEEAALLCDDLAQLHCIARHGEIKRQRKGSLMRLKLKAVDEGRAGDVPLERVCGQTATKKGFKLSCLTL